MGGWPSSALGGTPTHTDPHWQSTATRCVRKEPPSIRGDTQAFRQGTAKPPPRVSRTRALSVAPSPRCAHDGNTHGAEVRPGKTAALGSATTYPPRRGRSSDKQGPPGQRPRTWKRSTKTEAGESGERLPSSSACEGSYLTRTWEPALQLPKEPRAPRGLTSASLATHEGIRAVRLPRVTPHQRGRVVTHLPRPMQRTTPRAKPDVT